MKIFLSLILLFLTVSQSYSQQPEFDGWTLDNIKKANTAYKTNLSEQEKRIYLLCNLARLNGKLFADTYLKSYLKDRNSSYTASLFEDLYDIENLPMLKPVDGLCISAKVYAADMGSTGKVGHNSSDGTNCFERIGRYFECGSEGENCSYGYNQAIDIVMQLLIDDGVPSLGHRQNILNKDYYSMGISIKPHLIYQYNCVMDLAGCKIGNDDTDNKDDSMIINEDDDYYDIDATADNYSGSSTGNSNSYKVNNLNNKINPPLIKPGFNNAMPVPGSAPASPHLASPPPPPAYNANRPYPNYSDDEKNPEPHFLRNMPYPERGY